MSFYVQEFTLAAAVADAGTVTVTPTSYTQADYIGANAASDAVVIVNDNEVYTEAASEIAMSYDGSNVEITNDSGVTWPAGATIRVQFAKAGGDRPGFEAADAITSLTDNSGGTASNTLADVTEANNAGSADRVPTENAIASLATKVNAILVALRTQGIIDE